MLMGENKTSLGSRPVTKANIKCNELNKNYNII